MRIRRILMVSRAELVILIALIVNMVVKPAGNAGWFWGLLAVMFVGVAAVVATYFRSNNGPRRPRQPSSYSSSSTSTAPPATRSPSATWTARTFAS
jgi:hypothetical protein